ncbi:hypothetical protein AB1Y20_022552 [Prymnesium parvum]|uniref:Uncharacterized protein n=1 Tax=Prymnesium parvum TaxID=97485 RepID=A0AB34JG90_PRYPA
MAETAPVSGFIQWDGLGDWRRLAPDAPLGNITLRQLIGATNLDNWKTHLERTQAAFDAIRRGSRHEPPGPDAPLGNITLRQLIGATNLDN